MYHGLEHKVGGMRINYLGCLEEAYIMSWDFSHLSRGIRLLVGFNCQILNKYLVFPINWCCKAPDTPAERRDFHRPPLKEIF